MNSLHKNNPDFSQFLKVLYRKEKPNHLPFYEHVASSGFIARRTETSFDKMGCNDPDYWKIYVDFWLGMGYDCIPMEVPLNCPLSGGHFSSETHSIESESKVVIRNREDFEKYPWPDISTPIDFRHFETVSKLLPDGVSIVGGVSGGPYEWVSMMLGVMGISYLLADDPELVEDVFKMIGDLHHSTFRQLGTMDAVGALRQGDDLGFKSSTFLSPKLLRKMVFPIYRSFVEEAHANDKPFILHSCGNLAEVYDDLIDCGIDAKHSFEETIMPVEDFKKQYGSRITPMGGLDVDMICRGTEEEIRAYTRSKIEQCFYDGFWALGTGNSLTDYMPVENYLIALDEGRRVTG
jgi:uroporphyrinogen decarboxylase